ncbi:ABC transporter ATP-binding protein [Candidatus Sumerlaeota bacterium]|nr:ABC transporter ATP-binding protein [Candidatus Sumerlaeota bacterium]
MPPPGRHQYDEKEYIPENFDLRILKRLSHYITPFKKLIFLAVLLSFVSMLAGLFFDMIIFHVAFKKFPEAKSFSEVAPFILPMLLLPLFLAAIQFAMSYSISYIGQCGMDRLRRDLFEKLQFMHVSYFDKRPLGKILTRLTNDVEALNSLFSDGIVSFITDIFLLTGIIGFMFYRSAMLTWVMLCSVPFIFIASLIFRKYARAAYRRTRKHLGELNGHLQENINGMRIVQIFNRERWSYDGFDTHNGNLRDAHISAVKAHATFFPIIELIVQLTVAALILCGGYIIAKEAGLLENQKALTIDVLLLFIHWIHKFFNPIRDLTEKYNILQAAIAAAERIVNILETKVEITDPQQPVEVSPLQHSITFENVWFAYKDEDWVLKDVSFEVKKGETAAIVGATGAGKTTIISLLNRFYDVQKGAIKIDGVDIRQLRIKDLRDKLAIVLQDVFVFAGDIRENIRLWNEDIGDEQVQIAAETVNAARFIGKLENGYDSEVVESGHTFSMGQRQLLAFARALAYNPELLILDEATSNIDTETELLIQRALERLFEGRTSIIIAHRLSTIRHAGKIIVMHHGRVREIGTHVELMQQDGIYRRLCEIQYHEALAS